LEAEHPLESLSYIVAKHIKPYPGQNIIPLTYHGPTRLQVLDALQKSGVFKKSVVPKYLRPAGATPTTQEVGKLIEKETGFLFREHICSNRRETHIIRARFKTIYVLRRVCGLSLSRIGTNIGDRDHTTIMNGLNKIETDRKNDVAVRDETDHICEKADLIGMRNILLNLKKRQNINI
jgi:hypothetical protein